ncbi:MAG: hypothetical protein VXV96_15485 [Bdellovibrionota bacterium]|jgi:hypothetical protein|nr:hypothetical protein [Bdellovibrionota bacterium]
MKYLVAIKKDDYTAEFSFNSEEERQEFVETTKNMHPTMEFLFLEEGDWTCPVIKYAQSA